MKKTKKLKDQKSVFERILDNFFKMNLLNLN